MIRTTRFKPSRTAVSISCEFIINPPSPHTAKTRRLCEHPRVPEKRICLVYLEAAFLVSLVPFTGATSVLSSWRRY